MCMRKDNNNNVQYVYFLVFNVVTNIQYDNVP